MPFENFAAVPARLRREMTKFYHLCLNSGAEPSLQLQHNSLLLSSWATRDKKFSWTSPLKDRKVPIVWTADWLL